MPIPAYIAAKESMDNGFVSVRKNVETYAPKRLVLFSEGDFSNGLARSVFTPRSIRNAPPTKRNHTCCGTNTSEMKVNPNAAMHPYVASAVAAPKPEIQIGR